MSKQGQPPKPMAKKKAAAKKTAPRKAAARTVSGPPRKAAKKRAQKKTPRKKVPKKKAPAKKTPGSVSVTTKKATDGKRTTVDPGAIMLLKDENYAPAVIEGLREAFTPEVVVDEFKNLLEAVTENKHGQATPDFRTRIAALKEIILTVVGKPLDRVEITNTTTWDDNELEELIAHSPELRQELWKMLAPYEEERQKG